MTKASVMIIRYSLVPLAILLLFSGLRVSAQTKPNSASASQAVAVPARITQVIDETQLVTLKGNVHPLARPEFDQGAVSDATPATRMLLLLQRSPEQESALRALMDQQQDKTSSNYHAWLTPQQFAKQFGPADADVQAITGWLQSHGFQNVKIGAGRTTIEFSGNGAQLRSAFHTDIHEFLVHGEQHFANVSDPQVPAALAPVINGVMGLQNFRPKSQMHRINNFQNDSDKVVSTKPLVTLGCGSNGTTVPCYGVAPADFATIYNVPNTLNGTGVTIAIVQDSNINISDIQQFRSLFGLSNNFTASNIIFNGPDPGIQGPDSASGDEGEALLDVEWSGAVAQGANIQLVVSENSQTLGAAGIDLSALYIVDNNIAPILSESFGACEAALGTNGVEFYNFLWEQAAAQGITAILSAGDSGSDSCDNGSGDFSTTGLGISGLASTPFNVAMGGTDFQNGTAPSIYWNTPGTETESAKSYIPEETWNGSCAATATTGSLGTCTATIINQDTIDEDGIDLEGGGGGQSAFSTINAKPAWQLGVVPSADAGRDIPDLSLFSAVNTSNNDFYITCEQDSPSQNGSPCTLSGQTVEISPVGGTSAAAPAFAGIMALIIQQQGGARQGNANFVLYQLFRKDLSNTTLVCPSTAANVGTTTCIFYDVVTGNNSVACESDTPNCSNTSTAANQYGVLVDPNNASNPAFLAIAGYDKATGLGSVNVANLAKAWGTATFDSTTTTITTAPTGTIAHGATVTFAVNVTSASGTPTGTVSLIASPPGSSPVAIGVFDNTTTSTFALSGGIANITTNLLPGYVVGGVATPYPVVAQYAGDGTFAAGTSTPVNVTVGQEPSATAISLVAGTTTATSVVYGSPYITRVDVVGTGTNSGSQECSTSAVPCPTGSISLTDNGSNLNDFQNTQTGVFTNTATLPNDLGFLEDQLIQLPGGTNSLVAKYSGDTSYTASTSPALVVTVTPAATLASVTASATSTTTATPVTLTALISTQSSGAGPTGTVTFSTSGTSLGTATVVPTAASGLNTAAPVAAFSAATLSHTFATAGTYTISVSYATGDLNYSSSSSSASGNATLTITQGTVTGDFAVSYSPQPLVLSSATGAAVPLTVTVTPAGGFTGVVAVTAATLPPGMSCTPSPLNINVVSATAVASQLMCMVTATSTTLTASNARGDGMFEAQAIPPAKAIPRATPGKGWWTLSAGTGFAALFLLFLPRGRKNYCAALGLGLICILSFTLGCGGGGGSQQPPPTLTQTVTKLTVNGDKVASGTAFTFSASVTGGTPTGQVELFDNGTMIGAAATVSGGSATPTAPALSVGTHSVSAHYLGDAMTAASNSGTLNMTVTGSTTVTITTSPVATPAAPAISVTIQ